MSTQPPEPKLLPPVEPVKVEATFQDLDALDHAAFRLEAAGLFFTLIRRIDDGSRWREEASFLLDVGEQALSEGCREFNRTLRVLHMRSRAARTVASKIALRRRPGEMPK